MHSDVMKTPAASAEEVVRSVLDAGVRISRTNDHLSYKTPVGQIDRDQIRRLQVFPRQILAALRGVIEEPTSNQRVDYAPLAYSQSAHWHLHQLMKRPSVRIVAPAIRLTGDVNISALKASIEALMCRHEALRTRMCILGGAPIQVIPASVRWNLVSHDLTAIPVPARDEELEDIIEKFVFESIDVTKDALFSALLVSLSTDEYVLILAMDHLISDGVSAEIIVREFIEMYRCEIENRPVSLPEISVQFADYAVWQKSNYKSWLKQHGSSSDRNLAGCRVTTLHEERIFTTENRSGVGVVRLRMDRGLRAELATWSRARRTTMVLCVFSVFVALVLRWYGTRDEVFQYQVNGRHMPEVQNTLGYFAFRLFLRIEINEKDTFIDLLNRVQAEFAVAYGNREFSSMQVYEERADMTRSPCFNWNALSSIGDNSSCGEKRGNFNYSRVIYGTRVTHLDNMKTDTQLMALLSDVDNEILGSLQFPCDIVSFDTIERLGRNFTTFIYELLRRPDRKIVELKLA